jgi:uncharacterized protein (TIGR03435 family)
MKFDSATIRPDTTRPPGATNSIFPLGPGDVYVPTRGLFQATNYPLLTYIVFAYKLNPNQEQPLASQVPQWVASDRFDIQARVEGNPTKDQMRLMMQALLAERFRLQVHYETRQLPVFALLLDQPEKLGPLLQRNPDGSPCPTTPVVPSPAPTAPPQAIDNRFPATCGGIVHMPPSAPGRERGGARNVPMELIAGSFVGAVNGMDRPILDKTGLTGSYDFALEFAPQSQSPDFRPDPTAPTFTQALKDQLGLKLETETGPIQILVVDYVEHPSPN